MNNLYLGIDPGPTMSGYAVVDNKYCILEADKLENEEIVTLIRSRPRFEVIVESLACYGMPVGREVFETAFFIGRIQQVCRDLAFHYYLYPRPEYAKAICGVNRVTDAVLRQALLIRFGDDKKGGPMYLLKGASDKRSAFAIVAHHLDLMKYQTGYIDRIGKDIKHSLP